MKVRALLLLLVLSIFFIGVSHGAGISFNVHETPFQGGFCSDLSPSQIQNAYGFTSLYNSGITGTGQNVAIVVSQGDPTLTSDLATFDSYYGLPTLVNGSNLKIIVPFGDSHPSQSSSENWTVETALDTEVVHSLAPQATIYLVIAPNDSWLFNTVNYALNNLPIQTLSLSWGASEDYYASSQINSINQILSKAATKHISVFAASGDSGAYNGLSTLNVNFPASSQYVIGVGGTSLSVTNSGSYISESAWSGSGGGYSKFFSKPTPQPNVSSYRMVPDVSFNAATPLCAYINSAWGGYYGTSVAAPSWAAFSALVNQKASGSGVISLKSLYDAYYSKGSLGFNIISSGSNGYYSANGGYSLVTGLGSPKAYALTQILTAASYKLSFNSTQSDTVFEINGINYTSPVSLNFSYGQHISLRAYSISHNSSIRYSLISYSGYTNSTNSTVDFFVYSPGHVTSSFKTQYALNEFYVNGTKNVTLFEDEGSGVTVSSKLRYIDGQTSYSLLGIKNQSGNTLYNSSITLTMDSPLRITFLWNKGGVTSFTFIGAPPGATASVSYTDYLPLSNSTSIFTSTVSDGGSISYALGSMVNYSGAIYNKGYRYFLQGSTVLPSNQIELNFVKEVEYSLKFVSAGNYSVEPTGLYVTSASANASFKNSTVWAPLNEDFTLQSVILNNNGFNVLEHGITLSQSNFSIPIKLEVANVSTHVVMYLGIPVIGASVKFMYKNLSLENTTGATGVVYFNNVPYNGYNIVVNAYGSSYSYSGLSKDEISLAVNPFMYQLYIISGAIALTLLVLAVWEIRRKKR